MGTLEHRQSSPVPYGQYSPHTLSPSVSNSRRRRRRGGSSGGKREKESESPHKRLCLQFGDEAMNRGRGESLKD
ncbi:hypothetical protein RRG08_043121 [Elysia crispata]|uniref:Uncharacterized protein n=1 Tax=Elysia crispata TaxID=231223 RepID=A0AAE1CPH7_9GAST|nr:hypothetical protein RRG08_043121 [Elysia crispata]